jgi:hypothetical protein
LKHFKTESIRDVHLQTYFWYKRKRSENTEFENIAQNVQTKSSAVFLAKQEIANTDKPSVVHTQTAPISPHIEPEIFETPPSSPIPTEEARGTEINLNILLESLQQTPQT